MADPMTSDFQFSSYGSASSIPSPVNRLMAEFAEGFRDGADINLGVGYVNEETIPSDLIQEALDAIIADPDRYRQAFNYGGPEGSINLRNSIRNFLVSKNVGGLTESILSEKRIVIGANGATSLLQAFGTLFDPGIVITTDPMYYIYCNYLERRGFELVTVPEDHDGMNTDALRSKILALGDKASQVRYFYAVTVSNPTSTVLSNERRKEIVEIVTRLSAEQGRSIPIAFDTSYELLVHDPEIQSLQSGFRHDNVDLVYELGTVSKVFAPALRVGYLIGPNSALTSALVQWNSDAGFSAPLINQEMASYLIDHHISEQIERVNQGYREKAARTRNAIEKELGPLLEDITGGSAGFYYYLTFRDTETVEGSPFFRYLARTTGDPEIDGPPGNENPRVVYLPGEFCVHPKGDLAEKGRRQLRISYAFEDVDRIVQAVEMMREAAEYVASV